MKMITSSNLQNTLVIIFLDNNFIGHNHYNFLKCDWCINCCILL